MTDPVLAAFISAVAIETAAIIGFVGVLLRNRRNHGQNPKDPDKLPLGQVSVGWFMDEFEKRMARAVAEGTRRRS